MNIEVSLMQMEKLINFVKIVDLNLYDKVFINMTSVLNNMFYPTMINELADAEALKQYRDTLKTQFKVNIMNSYRKDKEYFFYYSSQPSSNRKYHPEWDRAINSIKFSEPFISIYREFISAVNILGKQMKNIHVIDMKNIESAYFPTYYSLHHKVDSRCLIISRDMIDFIAIGEGFSLFDGICVFKDLNKYAGTKKFPLIPNYLFKYYCYLKGIKKHSYDGVKGMGEVKSVKHIISNINNLDNDITFKKDLMTIFDIKRNISENNIKIYF